MKFFGALLFVAAILGGLYVGLWVCCIGGIVQIINAAQHTPVDAFGIALGIVRFMCASVAGYLTFIIGSIIAAACFTMGID